MKDQAEKLRLMAKNSSTALPQPPRGKIIKQQQLAKSRVITVTSGKGGVGKTNFTINLALALAAYQKKVLVIDADLGMANIDIVLGCHVPYTLMHLLSSDMDVNDVITEGPCGIKFLSGGSGIHELANLSNEALERLVRKITLFDSWADIILIDTGAGIHRNVINFVMAADEVILITTPEPTAITDAYAMVKTIASHQVTAPLHLVVNRVLDVTEGQFVFDKLGHVAQKFLKIPLAQLGFIYEDRSMMEAVKKQKPLLLSYPNSISSQCIEEIAYKITLEEKILVPKGIRGFFSKFLDILR
ncbi:MAG: MinD/ParA family protein [Sporomusaceae bacterium]|nr:MinD/ParA family protein [Sporomusaceae bacterium]